MSSTEEAAEEVAEGIDGGATDEVGGNAADADDIDLDVTFIISADDLPVLADLHLVVVVAVGEDVVDAAPEVGRDRLQLVAGDSVIDLLLLEFPDQFRLGIFGVCRVESGVFHDPVVERGGGLVALIDQVEHQEEEGLQVVG